MKVMEATPAVYGEGIRKEEHERRNNNVITCIII